MSLEAQIQTLTAALLENNKLLAAMVAIHGNATITMPKTEQSATKTKASKDELRYFYHPESESLFTDKVPMDDFDETQCEELSHEQYLAKTKALADAQRKQAADAEKAKAAKKSEKASAASGQAESSSAGAKKTAASEAPADEKKKLTVDDCRAAITAYGKEHGRPEAMKLLGRYGVKLVPELPEDQYEAFVAECNGEAY